MWCVLCRMRKHPHPIPPTHTPTHTPLVFSPYLEKSLESLWQNRESIKYVKISACFLQWLPSPYNSSRRPLCCHVPFVVVLKMEPSASHTVYTHPKSQSPYVLRVTALTQGLTEPEAPLFPVPTTPHFTDKTSWVWSCISFFGMWSLHSPGCLGTQCVGQAELECTEIFLHVLVLKMC